LENNDLRTLFNSYLEKKASPEEVKLLLDYFQMEKEGSQLRAMILSQMEQPLINENVVSIHEDSMYKRVADALSVHIDSSETHVSFWRRPLIRIAVSVAAIAILMSGYVLWNNSNEERFTTISAAYGKILQVELPDSSTVWLNAGTTLIYPEKFKGNIRSVTLRNGEAYFEVKHDSKHAFVVRANKENITVLGTSFEINAIEKQKEDKITVSTGKVGVQLAGYDRQAAVFLLPGERAVLSKSAMTIRKTKVDLSDIAVWREQRLIFEDQPLPEVMQSLERKYNIQIRIENKKLLTEKVSMRLNNQPLTDVLTAISFANHFNYKKINDQLIVVK